MEHRGADEIWDDIRTEAAENARQEPALAGFLHTSVLNHSHLEAALSYVLASKLGGPNITALTLRDNRHGLHRRPHDRRGGARRPAGRRRPRPGLSQLHRSTPCLLYTSPSP